MTKLLNVRVLIIWVALTVVIVNRPVIGGDVLYDYDSLGRLIVVTYSNGTVVTYDYDALGNRIIHTTSVIDNQAPEITSTPNTNAIVGSEYTYDANSQVEASGSSPISFSLGNGPDGFSVASDGQVSWTPSVGQEGVHAVEIIASNSAGNVSQSFNISVDPATLNFNDFTLDIYGGSQDSSGTVAVEDSGASVRLLGNRWQQIQIDYTVTANTVLEFDFSSSAQGDVHGIGFDTDLELTEQFAFELFGTQTWGLQDFHNYALNDGIKHYVIPVGQFYTGFMPYLFFVNDHDVNNPNAESLFSNIKVYEVSDNIPPVFTSTPVARARVAIAYAYDANKRVEASGAAPISFSLGSGPDGFTVTNDGQVSWTPSVGQEGEHAVEIIATNNAGSVSQSFNITVGPATPSDILNFNDYALGSYGGSQDSSGTVTIEDNGTTLRLVGNRWQQIPVDYTVTENTVLEFDFSSSLQADVHGIGFDKDLQLSPLFTFQLYGTQNWGAQDFHNYTLNNGVRHYVIPVGQFYTAFVPNHTGLMPYLC